MSEVPNKLLQSQCREITERSYQTLEFLIKEIETEIEGERIEGENSFDYAKKTIRKQGIKEGLKLLLQRINKYADGR